MGLATIPALVSCFSLSSLSLHLHFRSRAAVFCSEVIQTLRFLTPSQPLSLSQPIMFDEPVEHVIDYLFDTIEHFLFSSSKTLSDLKSEIPSSSEAKEAASSATNSLISKAKEAVPSPSSDSSLPTPAKALLLGVGVDLMFLPRLKNLANRHSSRILKELNTVGLNGSKAFVGNHKVEKARDMAINRFAGRILCEREKGEWKLIDAKREEERLRWLAVR